MSNDFTLPTVAVSLDGKRAIGLLELSADRYHVTNRDAFGVEAVVQLQPLAKPVPAEILVTGSFEASWRHPMQNLGWDLPLAEALPGLALLELGELLDGSPSPAEPTDASKNLSVFVSSRTFSVFERDAVSEDEIYRFLQLHTFWSWRYKITPARFSLAEAARLGVRVDDLMHFALRGEGELWTHAGDQRLSPLPSLLRRFEARAVRPRSTSPAADEGNSMFEVALSFAGEQRDYVREVAHGLRDADVRVFYDEFAEVELWGSELGSALGEIYERRARYIVVFVSDEYLAKSWPEHERQHAISGRIERKDASVLPVRFDDVDLPGLPGTVGYLDGRSLKPGQLVERILQKLRKA